MTKTSNKFNSLAQIEFVEDIDQETAANYSGGIGRINDGNNNPDVILYENGDFQGRSIYINAAVNDGIPVLPADWNDKTSSIKIIRGTWEFYANGGYGSGQVSTAGSGTYNRVAPGDNDTLSSLKRIG
jgi:Beta/Gamma crystallin